MAIVDLEFGGDGRALVHHRHEPEQIVEQGCDSTAVRQTRTSLEPGVERELGDHPIVRVDRFDSQLVGILGATTETGDEMMLRDQIKRFGVLNRDGIPGDEAKSHRPINATRMRSGESRSSSWSISDRAVLPTGVS